MRSAGYIALNVLVPGAGLVLLRREWLGTALAFLFCGFGQLGLLGGWIIPGSIPHGVTWLAAATSVVVWIVAQALFWSRWAALHHPSVPQQKAALIQLASEAMGEGIYVNARLALESALALDDEDLAANLLWARLLTTMGWFPEARKAWRRVEQLDQDRRHHREVVTTLRQLPSDD